MVIAAHFSHHYKRSLFCPLLLLDADGADDAEDNEQDDGQGDGADNQSDQVLNKFERKKSAYISANSLGPVL